MPEGRRHRLVRVPSGVRDRGVQRADRRDDHRARFHRLSGPDQRGVYGAMWRCCQRREGGGQRCPPRKKEIGNGKEQERLGDGHVPRAREHGRAARAQDRPGRGRVRHADADRQSVPRRLHRARRGEVPRGAAEGAGEGSGRTTTRWSGQRAVKPSEMQRRIDKALAKPEPEKPGVTHPPGTVGLRRVCGSVSWRVRVAGSADGSSPPGCSGSSTAGAPPTASPPDAPRRNCGAGR